MTNNNQLFELLKMRAGQSLGNEERKNSVDNKAEEVKDSNNSSSNNDNNKVENNTENEVENNTENEVENNTENEVENNTENEVENNSETTNNASNTLNALLSQRKSSDNSNSKSRSSANKGNNSKKKEDFMYEHVSEVESIIYFNGCEIGRLPKQALIPNANFTKYIKENIIPHVKQASMPQFRLVSRSTENGTDYFLEADPTYAERFHKQG